MGERPDGKGAEQGYVCTKGWLDTGGGWQTSADNQHSSWKARHENNKTTNQYWKEETLKHERQILNMNEQIQGEAQKDKTKRVADKHAN